MTLLFMVPVLILPYRLGPEATSIAARMPPIARRTVHGAAFDLVTLWINEVVNDSYANAEAGNGSGSSGAGIPLCLPGEVPGLGGMCLPL